MSLNPICSAEGSISGFSRIETRSQRQLKALKEHTASNTLPDRGKSASFTFSNYFLPVVKSVMPLPELDWADPKEVWAIMLQKDRKYHRDPLYFRKHSFLQPRMRAILLDWLTEVSISHFLFIVMCLCRDLNQHRCQWKALVTLLRKGSPLIFLNWK